MTPPDIPIDEARRLFALYRLQILDTAAEPAFDHITALAQKLFDVPIALISLVDMDRQWFKSRAGIAATETSRAISFCGHTIHEDRIFIVNNASQDVRFHDNPTVIAGPRIQAYAGAPLHAPGGERIGTVCVMDTRARNFTAAELEPLHALAGIVEDILCRSDDVLRTAYYDTLTGLPNRLMLVDKLTQAITQARAANQQVAVLAINIDQFKGINQALGYQVGDKFLNHVARRLVDCVSTRGVVSRTAADEFVVAQIQYDEPAALQSVCNQILERIAEPISINGIEISATASIGVSHFPQDAGVANALLACADIALTQAKEHGRNTTCIYTRDARIEPHQRFQLYSELRQALLRSEFELYYQPEFDLATDAIVRVEALLRWNHPRLGLLGPADFIEVAEDSGLIVPIGEWVLQEACREAQRWRAGGFHAGVAVNLSALQFKRSNLEQTVAGALHSAALPAHCLELELTESILIGDNDTTQARIQRLQALGVSLAIDDFGTGYSNLAYLRRFAFDKLKIDQSFVRRMAQSSEDLAIVTAIIQLAASLKLNTVAEGVETKQQLQQLQMLGCSTAQGYLFAKPMPAPALRELVRHQGTHRGANHRDPGHRSSSDTVHCMES